MKKNQITAAVCLAAALAIATVAGMNFLSLKNLGEIKPGESVTETKMLSEYFDGIKGTNMDTPVYVLKGEKPGGSVLVLGGTHGNE
ncbi:MAG: succinylglutamate desuccinylase, partial [Lachnospiraceae bacterium]